MTLYELCLDYLDCLNTIASGHYLTPLKLLVSDKIDVQTRIAENLECNLNCLTMVMDNLDIAIGFEPPTKRYESVKVYAKELEQLLTCTAGQMFLNGKMRMITTSHGTIKETTS